MKVISLAILACLVSAMVAEGNELIARDRHGLPYLDDDALRALAGEDAAQDIGALHERRLQECDEKWEPVIEELYVPGHSYHLEAEGSWEDCLTEAVHRTAREVTGSPTAGDEWFTCSAPSLHVCVEYKIEDALDRQNLMRQCAHDLQPGRQCSVDGPRCENQAPGRTAVTYGGASPATIQRACLASKGEYSCYGHFC